MSSDNFLSDLDKWVMESFDKKAEEALRQGADSSHPSQNTEDGDKPATEGARSSENEADVKADIPGDNVDTAKETEAEGPGRGENTPALEMANAKPTGEDPANETAGVKDKPEDPGTAHPAKATMGEKYSAAQLMTMGDEILNDIAALETEKSAAAEVEIEVEGKEDEKSEDEEEEKSDDDEESKEAAAEKSAEDKPYCKTCKADTKDKCHCGEKKEAAEADGKDAEGKAEEAEAKEAEAKDEVSDEIKQAEEAGRAAAASIIEAVQNKQASAEAPAVDPNAVIDSIVKNAAADAQNVIEYLAMFKQAMGDMPAEEVAALADAAAAEAPVTDVPAEVGAIEDVAGAAPVDAGMGGDAEVEALVDALVEAGVEPEELLALAGEGEGGMPAAPVADAGAEAPVEDVVEEAAVEDVPKEAAKDDKSEKKAAIREALKTAAKKTA
jgi:hypothetical protein